MAGLIVTIDGRNDPFKQKVAETVAISKAAGAEMAATGAPAVADAGTKTGQSFFQRFINGLKGHGSGGMQQLVHVVRATFDSLASGMNPFRVFLQQAPQALQAFWSLGGSAAAKFILGFGVVAAAVAGIVASPFIFLHRVNGLVLKLNDSVQKVFNADHIPKYLQKVNEMAEAEKDVTDAVDKRLDAYNSVSEAAARELAVAKQKIDYERELLEARKANDLAAATSVRQRAEIEKKYAAMGMALNKQQRDAELAAMIKDKAALEAESKQKLLDMESAAPKFSEARHEQDLQNAKEAADKSKAYFAQAEPGKKDDRAFSMDKDRVLARSVDKFESEMAWFRAKFADWWTDPVYKNGLEKARAVAQAAQSRINQNQGNLTAYNRLLDNEGDVKRAFQKAEDLRREAEKSAAAAAILGGPEGEIARKVAANKASDAQEAAVSALRLARKDPLGNGQSNGSGNASVTDRERIGAASNAMQATTLDIQRRQLSVQEKLLQHFQSQTVDGNPAVGGAHFV